MAGLQQPMPPSQAVQVATAVDVQPQEARVKLILGDWQICEDSQGEYYVHVSGQSFDQPPEQLVQLYQASQGQVSQPVAAPEARIKMTVGEWQICEDAQGEYYVHTPTGQSSDQPPSHLVQFAQPHHLVPHQATYATPPAVVLTHELPPTYVTHELPPTYASSSAPAYAVSQAFVVPPAYTYVAPKTVAKAENPTLLTNTAAPKLDQVQEQAPTVRAAKLVKRGCC